MNGSENSQNKTLIEQLNWRYATKQFDSNKKISSDDWNTLQQATILSPSSYGLQPWKMFNVINLEVRKKLRAAAWDQPQVTDASHLVVFANRIGFNTQDIEALIERTSQVRNSPKESLAGLKGMISSALLPLPQEQLDAWTARQAYIALGFLLAAAANIKIDACPMEGFDTNAFNEILDIPKTGYGALVMCTLGYRSSQDKYAAYSKVRFTQDHLVQSI